MGFGIGMNPDHTLKRGQQQCSVTREHIRQIEAEALRKLKHRSATTPLHFMEPARDKFRASRSGPSTCYIRNGRIGCVSNGYC
jgi:hypothetical protein